MMGLMVWTRVGYIKHRDLEQTKSSSVGRTREKKRHSIDLIHTINRCSYVFAIVFAFDMDVIRSNVGK